MTTVYYRPQFIKLVAQAISIGVHTGKLIKRHISVGTLVSNIIVTNSNSNLRILRICFSQGGTRTL